MPPCQCFRQIQINTSSARSKLIALDPRKLFFNAAGFLPSSNLTKALLMFCIPK